MMIFPNPTRQFSQRFIATDVNYWHVHISHPDRLIIFHHGSVRNVRGVDSSFDVLLWQRFRLHKISQEHNTFRPVQSHRLPRHVHHECYHRSEITLIPKPVSPVTMTSCGGG